MTKRDEVTEAELDLVQAAVRAALDVFEAGDATAQQIGSAASVLIAFASKMSGMRVEKLAAIALEAAIRCRESLD